jgi:hypothetical protein
MRSKAMYDDECGVFIKRPSVSEPWKNCERLFQSLEKMKPAFPRLGKTGFSPVFPVCYAPT